MEDKGKIALGIYILITIIAMIIFRDIWWIVGIISLMMLLGFLRTRHLEKGIEEKFSNKNEE